MRVRLAGAVIALLTATSGASAPGGCGNGPSLFPFAFETITVSSSSIGLTSTTYAPDGQGAADMAVATLATNAIRYRSDGAAPTAAVGHALAAADVVTVCGEASIRKVRFIAQAADGTLSVSYYREGDQ